MRASFGGTGLVLAGIGHVVFALMNAAVGSGAVYLWVSAAGLVLAGALVLAPGAGSTRAAAVTLAAIGATSVWRMVVYPWPGPDGTFTAGFAIHHLGIFTMGVAALLVLLQRSSVQGTLARAGSAAAAVGVVVAAFTALPGVPAGEVVEAIGFAVFAVARPGR